MIAPLEGAEGAMGVVVHGNQGKGGMGSPSDTPLASYFRAGLVLFSWYTSAYMAGGVRWRITRSSLKSGVISFRG